MRELCKHAGLTADIKRGSLENFGHVIRMVQTTAEETIKKTEGRKKVEMTKVNWMENGENYVREMKVKGFIKKADNSEE